MARERVEPFGGGQHQAGVPLPLHLVELHSYAHVLPVLLDQVKRRRSIPSSIPSSSPVRMMAS